MIQIQYMQTSTLKPAAYNPRKMPDEQMRLLMRGIEEFGIVDPIIINDQTGHIVGGHQRVEACLRLGIETVPVVTVDLSEAREKTLNIALNKIGGEWDFPQLRELMMELSELGEDLELTGWTDDELEAMMTLELEPEVTAGLTDPDDVPEPPAEPITKPGGLWKLGRHRLLCGDSTSATDVERLMGGRTAQMVWTDPPYNVDYDPESRKSYFSPERLANKLGKIQNDSKSPEDFRAFLDAVYSNLNASLDEGRAIYISHADTEGHHFRNAFIAQPWKLQSCLIWKKSVLVFGRADYHWMHEPILYGWKEGASHVWHGDRKQTTILEFPTDHYNKAGSDTDGYVHPTQKPTALIEDALTNSSVPGEIVLDLFGGSGSTLIAAEKLGRTACLMELDPKYCDVIVRRWEQFTGKKAELEA